MARQTRIHVSGGNYYVVLSSANGRQLFDHPEEYSAFTDIVARRAKEKQLRIHAYCWTTNEAHLAVETLDTPLKTLVQHCTSQYARSVNGQRGQTGRLFSYRHGEALISNEQMRDVIRHIHLAPVRHDPKTNLDRYEWSSHRAYIGARRCDWLAIWRFGESYRKVMSQDPAICLVESGEQVDSSGAVHRTRESLSRFSSGRRRETDVYHLHWIIDRVSETLGISPKEMCSPSRKRSYALGRALVAYLATQSDIATLSKVASLFSRSPSTLIESIDYYKKTRAALFEPSVWSPNAGV